jgi:FkbM family methyltransferase
LFVLYFLKLKRKGFFIEIGVGNGKDLSNTYILEKKFNWTGLLCEADTRMFSSIRSIRNVKLITYPVSDKCKKKFNFFLNTEDAYQSSSIKRKNSEIIKTKSLCLNHILEKEKAPKNIDYLSIDTEGTEYNIIKNLNFSKWNIKLITIEHNFNNFYRKKIFNLLSKKGYVRGLKKISYMDDWYLRTDIT